MKLQKEWYYSKTLWVNVLAFLAVILQNLTGKELLSPEVQTGIITIANIILRAVTKHELVVTKDE
jgi:hypothetical protein